jgi:hypothetical protein
VEPGFFVLRTPVPTFFFRRLTAGFAPFGGRLAPALAFSVSAQRRFVRVSPALVDIRAT